MATVAPVYVFFITVYLTSLGMSMLCHTCSLSTKGNVKKKKKSIRTALGSDGADLQCYFKLLYVISCQMLCNVMLCYVMSLWWPVG